MGLHIITPPDLGKPPVDAREAKNFLRLTSNEFDYELHYMILAVNAWLAGRDGWLGRSLVQQTLELRLAGFPCGLVHRIVLPRPPFIAIEFVKYDDPAGIERTLAPEAYCVSVENDGLPHLRMKRGQTWPACLSDTDSVRIRYTAGYGTHGGCVDEGIRHAILMTVARLFACRGEPIDASLRGDPFIQSLFAPYRVWL
jgi:uncharacterized phiE125 gp8 family phage protein